MLFSSYIILVSTICWRITIAIFNRSIHKECLVSSHSIDGFGHQLEAKISCIIAGILSAKISYIHKSFGLMDHSNFDINFPAMVENFTNIGFGSYRVDDLGSEYKFRAFSGYDARWIISADAGIEKCLPTIVNIVDNCWDIVYYEPMVGALDVARHEVQRRYFSVPKPNPNLIPGKFNVIIHIRRGDAGPRILPLGQVHDQSKHDIYKLLLFPPLSITRYYVSGIEHFKRRHRNLVFWVISDDPQWSGINEMAQLAALDSDFYLPSNTSGHKSLLFDFHRLVMAHGIIASDSSVSFSAILIGNATDVVVSPRTRLEEW